MAPAQLPGHLGVGPERTTQGNVLEEGEGPAVPRDEVGVPVERVAELDGAGAEDVEAVREDVVGLGPKLFERGAKLLR